MYMYMYNCTSGKCRYTHRFSYLTLEDMAVVDTASLVTDIQTEAVEQLVGVATGTEEHRLHGKDRHWLL